MEDRPSISCVDHSGMSLLKKHSSKKKTRLPTQLMSAWEARDLSKFTYLLNHFEGLNYAYGDSKLRIIDILARDDESGQYLAPLSGKVKIDSRNHLTGKYAIHYAAEGGNDRTLELLLGKGADANKQDLNDNTVLHILLKKWEPEKENLKKILNLLINQPNIAFNIPNAQGYTPIHLAAAMFDGPVQEILQAVGNKLDLDTFKCSDYNETAREVLLKNFPSLENNLPGEWKPDPANSADYRYRLFYVIKHIRGFGFIKLLREALDNKHRDLLTCTDGQRFTYLHRACEKGRVKSVKALINLGVNVNKSPEGIDTPIVVAARNGHSSIFTIILEKIDFNTKEGGEILLHSLVKISSTNVGSTECLKMLLSHQKLDVNEADKTGQTALHIATKISDNQSIFLLLDNGAKLDVPNSIGETPLDYISEVALRNYLDSKVTSNSLAHKDTNLEFSLNYQFSNNSSDNHSYILSSHFLNKIAKSHELKKLLAHPMYSTAISLKWIRIRPFFYIYLCFYSMFCVLTTTFIFNGVDLHILKNNHTTTTLNVSDDFPPVSSANINGIKHPTARILIFLCLLILLVTEISQMATKCSRYFRSLENWLQWVVIFSTSAVISFDIVFESATFIIELSALTILFIWMEFFFVIGDHPKLTFFIDIFRKVSMFLLKFICVHTALIFGFAFSFHILFRNNIGPFATLHEALFKTIIMLTGEFEVGEIPLNSYPIVSHIIFIVFVFLVAIVLFNLLIGLAVSATKTIEENPFLHRCISQVAIIYNFEDLYFSKDSFLLKERFKFLRMCLRLKSYQTSPILYVYPNQKNKIKIGKIVSNPSVNNSNMETLPGNLSQTIVDEIQIIIANKEEAESKRTDKIDELKQHFDGEINMIKNTLIEIMRQLKGENEQVETIKTGK